MCGICRTVAARSPSGRSGGAYSVSCRIANLARLCRSTPAEASRSALRRCRSGWLPPGERLPGAMPGRPVSVASGGESHNVLIRIMGMRSKTQGWIKRGTNLGIGGMAARAPPSPCRQLAICPAVYIIIRFWPATRPGRGGEGCATTTAARRGVVGRRLTRGKNARPCQAACRLRLKIGARHVRAIPAPAGAGGRCQRLEPARAERRSAHGPVMGKSTYAGYCSDKMCRRSGLLRWLRPSRSRTCRGPMRARTGPRWYRRRSGG